MTMARGGREPGAPKRIGPSRIASGSRDGGSPLGFIFGAVVLWLAQPTWRRSRSGAAIALVGEAIRVWAAGHLEKSREVTRSGPYRVDAASAVSRLVDHRARALRWPRPACAVAVIVALYVCTSIPAAIRAEEAHLREKFGGDYDAYTSRVAPPMARPFSLSRARFNREHHTIAGVLLGFALLARKVCFA